MIEIKKAAVFPVPVCDCTYKSCPSSEAFKTCSCTGVQSTYPAFSIPFNKSGCKFNSVNFMYNLVCFVVKKKHYL